MLCHCPISICDPSVKSKRVRITVPCGKCGACITNKRNDWCTRLQLESKYQDSAYFITLTYSDEHLNYADVPNLDGEIESTIPTLLKKDVQDFMKRLRRGLPKGKKIRYFAVGEYGTKTWRPHYHLLIFGMPFTDVRLKKYLLDKWNKGRIDIGTVTPASIRYCTNYLIQKNSFKTEIIEPPFALMSKGLGSQYISKHLKKHQRDHTRNYLVMEGGEKRHMPRYFRKKLYSKPTQEKQNIEIKKVMEEKQETNIEKWARLNPSQNQFDYFQEQNERYTKKIKDNLKQNSTL